MLDQDEMRLRLRAAMVLRGVDGFGALAKITPFGSTTLRHLGTAQARMSEKHLRPIAAALDVPYAWFEIEDVFAAVARDEIEPSADERLEALESQVGALLERLSDRPGPPAPPDELLAHPGDAPS